MSVMTDRPVIEVLDVDKSFGDVRAVRGLSFQVQPGSITALLGPNGAGKTTTIKLLLNLLRPDRGSIRILGLDVGRDSLAVRRRVTYVPEDRAFSPGLTVAGTIRLFRGLSGSWDDGLAGRLLEDFGLPASRKAGDLSKGMASQLALLLALAPRPDVLILDEPASGLDPVMRRQFMQSILGEVADRGQTVLLSSHNLTEVERVADTVLLMNGGRVVLSGPMDEVKKTEKKIRVVFQGGLPEAVSSHPAAVSISQEGRAYLISVSGEVDGLLAEIDRHRPFAVDVIDLSLEDIFLTHTGREKR